MHHHRAPAVYCVSVRVIFPVWHLVKIWQKKNLNTLLVSLTRRNPFCFHGGVDHKSDQFGRHQVMLQLLTCKLFGITVHTVLLWHIVSSIAKVKSSEIKFLILKSYIQEKSK